MKNANCIFNDRGAWCKNEKVKRRLFGLGARVCAVFNGMSAPARISSTKIPSPSPVAEGGAPGDIRA